MQAENASVEELPKGVVFEDGLAEVGPLVWWWDGEAWHGPEGSGDYGDSESQARRRS
jgi:hypothetical protein